MPYRLEVAAGVVLLDRSYDVPFELLDEPGPYREIYDLQLRDQEEAIASIAAATGVADLRPALAGSRTGGSPHRREGGQR